MFLPLGVCAQTKRSTEPKNESYITTDLFSPFYIQGNLNGFINSGTPRWRVGYVKTLNPKAKIGLDIGYGSTNNSVIQTFDNYSLWEIRPEYYHIITYKRKTLKYVSLELFYLTQNEKFETQSFFSEQQRESFSFDNADYNRQKFGIIPKFGMLIKLSNKIRLNWYTGIGLNYRINTYSNFVNLTAIPFNEEHFPPYYRNEGTRIGAEFTAGLKLYYKINR